MTTKGTPAFSGMNRSDQIISSVGDGVTVHDREFRIIYQNQTMKNVFGECVGMLCYEAYQQLSAVCPDCPVAACFSSGEVHTLERIVTIAEKTFVFETCASPIQDQTGKIVASVEVVRNATKRKEEQERIARLKHLYDAASRINKAIMFHKDKDSLFREVCRVLVSHGKMSLAAIGIGEHGAGVVTPVACSTTEYPEATGICATINGCDERWLPAADSTCWTEPYVCNDLDDTHAGQPWQRVALASGFHSLALFPLIQEGKPCGVLQVCSLQKQIFDPEVIEQLQEVAHCISFAIEKFSKEAVHRQAVEALRDSEERLRLVLEGSNDGYWIWDIKTGVVDLNPRFMSMLGYAPEKKIATFSAMLKLIHPDDRPQVRNAMYGQLSGSPSGFELEMRMANKRKKYEWLNCTGKVVSCTDQDMPSQMSGVVRNITEKKRHEDELQYKSTHDQLTGLYNRAYFDAELVRVAQSRQYPISIIIADVDGLKAINDNFGHAAGDRVIKQAAQALRQAFRGDDVVARIGGDEFAAILQKTDADIVQEAIRRILQFQALINAESNRDYTLSISLGSATADRSNQLEETLKLADSRMYYYKYRRKLPQAKGVPGMQRKNQGQYEALF